MRMAPRRPVPTRSSPRPPWAASATAKKDLVGALLFLLNNDAAGFITGICLPIDGGLLRLFGRVKTQKAPAFVRKPELFALSGLFFYILLFLLDFFHIAPEGRAADAQLTGSGGAISAVGGDGLLDDIADDLFEGLLTGLAGRSRLRHGPQGPLFGSISATVPARM